MSRIRKLYYFDKKQTEEMISFLNNSVYDKYINNLMFNPFLPLHYLLPLSLKFLPESYVLKDGKEAKGLITIAPIRAREKKVEIQKLFFEENSFEIASELIQFAVAKYKALGAISIKVKVDDYLPELITLLITKCGFSQISYEKLWRVNKLSETIFDKREFRSFRNSDAKAVTNIYNDSLLPHFRPLLGKEILEFKEPVFKGLSYNTEYKYVIEDKKTKNIIGCLIIKTCDNENYVLEIIQTGWINLDIESIINYVAYQIKKRKKRFGLFVKTKRYTTKGESYEKLFIEKGYECVQNQVVLTNSSARVLKQKIKTGKYTVITDFLPSNPVTQCKEL